MKFSALRSILAPLKKYQWRRKPRLCYWCGEPMLYREDGNNPRRASREHLIPKSDGGGGGRNVVAAHRECNNKRRSDTSWVPHFQKEDA